MHAVSRMDVVEAFLGGQALDAIAFDGNEDSTQRIVREEMMLMASTLSMMQAALGAMCADLDAQSMADAYSAEPWAWGYACGKARHAATMCMVLSHLANNIVVRATVCGDAE